MDPAMSGRLFRWLLPLLIAAGAFFGLAPFLAPAQLAAATGFTGTDVFIYRLAGSASFAYAVGLAVGFRGGWPELRIPIASTAVFNAGSIVACVAALASGAQPVVYVILAASILFIVSTGYFLARPPADRLTATAQASTPVAADRELAPWVSGLFLVGTLAATFFAVAPLVLGGGFGQLLGYSGADDFVYRQAGAATLGAAAGGVLVLASRRWIAARIPAVMALTFNGFSLVAAVLELPNGPPPVAWLILAAAAVVSAGMALALSRGGR